MNFVKIGDQIKANFRQLQEEAVLKANTFKVIGNIREYEIWTKTAECFGLLLEKLDEHEEKEK